MTTQPIDLHEPVRADLLNKLDALEAEALRRDETMILAAWKHRDDGWHARVEFVEAAE